MNACVVVSLLMSLGTAINARLAEHFMFIIFL